jgi:hypothetical protein
MVKKKSAEHSGDIKIQDVVSKKSISKFFKNYWAVSTVILAILLVAVLVGNLYTPSKTSIGQKVVDFAAEQGAQATLVSVTKANNTDNLYEVVLSIQGQEVPVYVTEDGKYLVPTIVPMKSEDANPTTNTNNDQPVQTNIPKSNKPVVEAFVMSHCPYGTQIEKGLIPVANLLGDKIDFEIKFVYYAMHPSAGEVQEQLNQYCIQKEQNAKYIDYLTCFLDKGDGKSCVKSVGVDETELATCVEKTDKEFQVTENLNDESKWLSGRFPLFNIYKADNEKYSVGGSPTLIINGVEAQAGRDSASLLKAICAAFETAPEECNTELSSAAPSPGFGFSTTSGSTTSATCG